jgi:IS1 family transposase
VADLDLQAFGAVVLDREGTLILPVMEQRTQRQLQHVISLPDRDLNLDPVTIALHVRHLCKGRDDIDSLLFNPEDSAIEADEMASFVKKKTNKQWIWLAMDVKTRQIIAFHVGDRSRKSARQLWVKIPKTYRRYATFHTDQYVVYKGVIPAVQHQAITKKARKTNTLNGLTTRCINVCHVWCAVHCRFPKSSTITPVRSKCLSAITI